METSKLYIELGKKVNIRKPRFTHRGIIAKRILHYVDSLELTEFSKSFKKIDVTIKGIKVNDNGSTYYL
jgi:hypothetical protein